MTSLRDLSFFSFDMGCRIVNAEKHTRAYKAIVRRSDKNELWRASAFPQKARVDAPPVGRCLIGMLLLLLIIRAITTKARDMSTFIGIWWCATIITTRGAL